MTQETKQPQPVASDIRRAGEWQEASERCVLDYEARFIRRKRLMTAQGNGFLVDLAQTVSLDHGDAFVLNTGTLIEVIAAREALIEVRGADLVRLAWHIGNRHAPCQIAPDRLLVQREKVMQDMLEKLGADLCEVEEPFTPEGGAYGMGRTHGHAH